MVTIKATSKICLQATLTYVAARLVYKLCTSKEMLRRAQKGWDLLHTSDDLAEEFVEVPRAAHAEWEAEADYARVIADETPEGADDLANTSPTGEDAGKLLVAGSIKYDDRRRDVDAHYIVKNKSPYMRCVVAEAKNRFGMVERTTANVLAVRKFCLDTMSKHKVRPTHIAQMLPLVVECVFLRSDTELEALDIASAMRQTSGRTWMNAARNLIFGVSGRRVSHTAA